ncbi:MAG: M23 family metallopeptidase [Verrucomicrobiae bacterium]|nr:M23 family metallopeptidase [Verrucomicrobiae bacterium]
MRQFLPLFVMVFSAGLIAFAIWGPEADPSDDGATGLVAHRVGLLPVVPLDSPENNDLPADQELPFDSAFVIPRTLDLARAPQSPRFDAPMGSVLGALTYNAQPFLTTRHLGEDINGIGGSDSDLGDPVYAAGDGEVVYAGWPSDGWGNVVMLLHRLSNGESVTTFYGHLLRFTVPVGATVRRGDRIGFVGKADGRYLAHLHFEVRSAASFDPGAGYAEGPLSRRSGELFLAKHRGAPEDRQNSALGGDWDTRLPGTNVPVEGEESGPRMQIQTVPENSAEP